MRILLLDEEGREVPPGKPGEICILGVGLALGYYNAPEQTAASFIQNSQNGRYPEKMYKTGDLGYWDEEGNLCFLGRKDSQIKLRGNRIELGDIEAAAGLIEGVQNTCALYDEKHEKIVLFAESKEEFTLRKFNIQLGNRLPKYMLPGALFCLKAFPLTANRKINRRQLKQDYMENE